MNQGTLVIRRAAFVAIVCALSAGSAKSDPSPRNLGAPRFARASQDVAREIIQPSLRLKSVTFIHGDAPLAPSEPAAETTEEAEKRLNATLARDPKNIAALLGLAEVEARRGNSKRTVGLIEKAIAANSAAPLPRLALINYYLRNKDPKKAVATAQAAITALPRDPDIVDALGRAQLAAGANTQAVTTYAKLAKLAPDSPITWFRFAQAQAAANDKAAAVESLRKALAIKPDFLEAQRGLAGLEFQAGHMEQAIAVAREVQKQRPKESAGYLLEGDLYAYGKNWGAAAAAYRAGLNQNASTDLTMKLYAVLQAGGDPNAEKIASAWLKDHPKDDTFRLFMAGNAMDKKNFAEAEQQYRAILETYPNNPALLNNLAWVAAQTKDPKAIEYAERAHSLAPNEIHIMDTLGMILIERGDITRGMDLLRKALAVSPDLTSARLNLAKGLIKAGRKDDARKELEALTKLGDKFPSQNEVTALMKTL